MPGFWGRSQGVDVMKQLRKSKRPIKYVDSQQILNFQSSKTWFQKTKWSLFSSTQCTLEWWSSLDCFIGKLKLTRIFCICWSKYPAGRLSVEGWWSVILIFNLVLFVKLLRRKGGAHPLMLVKYFYLKYFLEVLLLSCLENYWPTWSQFQT